MKIKASKAITIKLTLNAAEAVALFWATAPRSIPASKRDQYYDIAREIESGLGEAIESAGIAY